MDEPEVVLDTRELERRMRPGAWSDGGFIGHNERLEEVLAADQETLESLGLTRAEIVESLELLNKAPWIVVYEHEPFASYVREDAAMQESLRSAREAIKQRFGAVEPMTSGPDTVARVGGRYEVRGMSSVGWQACPWSRTASDPSCASSTTRWSIRDTTRDLEMSGPGLIGHLITEHGFFEGFESPYRVDPRGLAELLRLGPFAG